MVLFLEDFLSFNYFHLVGIIMVKRFLKLEKLNVNDARFKNKVEVKVIKVTIHYTTFVKS